MYASGRWLRRPWPLMVAMATIWSHLLPASSTVKTRLITTKQGQLRGVIRNLGDLLGDVEIFTGVPYASPPIEEGRFTPTNTPPPWDGVLDATSPPPVCPQLLPDLDEAPKYMPKERVELIRNLLPLLANQSEDCLTLNIYAPIMVVPGTEVYPVMVFFHGESFSWGAGSLYDGSVLAAYGRVIVVTINFRLGPLGHESMASNVIIQGFLNTYGGGSGVVSNFALLDQITALNWVAENVGQFGGDPSRITLIGRDTGAASISLLSQSPIVPPGLFQRAILLSGGSWCPWARVTSPLSVTLRLAVALNCPMPKDPGAPNPNTVECLRNSSLPALMEAARNVSAPRFTPVWGPSEDGVVVSRGHPGSQQQGMNRIDWIVGVTPSESWSWIGEDLMSHGVSIDDFNKVVRTWVRNTHRYHLREIMSVAVQEYTDWTVSTIDPRIRRDLLLDLLSDAGTVAPLLRGADNLADSGKVFLFVCDFSSQLQHHQIQQSGWELSLLFGAGLSDSIKLTGNSQVPLPGPVLAELSEDVITLLTNFAKSGDPNLPRESPSPGFAAIAWPRYTKEERKYLKIGVPPSVGSRYRAHQLALWNWLVPELEAAGAHSPNDPDSWEVSQDKFLFSGEVRSPDPWYFLQPTTSTTTPSLHLSIEEIAAAPAAIATTSRNLTPKGTTTLALSPTIGSHYISENGEYVKYSTALLVTIGLGASLLLLNALIFLLLFWRKAGSQQQMHGCDNSHHTMDRVMALPRVGSIMSVSGNYGGPGHMGPLGATYGGPPDCIKSSYDRFPLTAEDLHRLSNSPPCPLKWHKAALESTKESPPMFPPNSGGVTKSERSEETSFTLDSTFRNLEMTLNRGGGGKEEGCRLRCVAANSTLLRNRPPTPCVLARTVPPDYLGPTFEGPSPAEPETQPRESENQTLDQPSILPSFYSPISPTTESIPSPPSNFQTPPVSAIQISPTVIVSPISGFVGNREFLRRSNSDHRRSNGWATMVGGLPEPPPPPRISTLKRDKKVTIVEEAVHRL